MRNDARNNNQSTNMASVCSYHARSTAERMNNVNYAFAGFKSNKYFTSDRFETLVADSTGLHRSNNKPIKGYGLEVELASQLPSETILAEVLDKIIFARFPADLFKQQSDCSLGGRSSSECITQVMTKEFIRNNYPNFKAMFDEYLPAFQTCADDSCGMHVNISRACLGGTDAKQSETCRKLFYFINHNFNLCCSLFRRKLSACHYCGRMDGTKEHAKTMNLGNSMSSHSVCFNLGHWNEGRIEIRLVAGQRSFAAFRNTMETVFFMIERCKEISWNDIDDFSKFFTGCNQYVYDRLTLCQREGTIASEQVSAIENTVVRADYI